METKISLRKLGQSKIEISPVGLGCWQFSKQNNLAGKFWPSLEDSVIREVVSLSLEGGINWFDTAEVYGNGASEKALADSLVDAGKKPGEVVVATKWWPAMRTSSSISRTIGERIDKLGPFPIDLHQVHQPFGFSGIESEMNAMADLFDRGLIKSVGISNFNAGRMRKAYESLAKRGIPLASNQVRYSLLDRRIEKNGVLTLAKELGITIIAYSPLAQGIVTGKFHDNPALLKNVGMRKYSPWFKNSGLEKSKPLVDLIKSLSIDYNVSTSQIALNWLINYHGETVVVIPGATKEDHVRENTGAMNFRLSEEDMIKIDRQSKSFL